MSRRPERPPHPSARRFPNTGEVAYFMPNSQTIHFNELREGDVEVMRASQDHRGLIGALGTAYHEFTHWADLVGTVWGRGYLRRIYGCLRLLDHVTTPNQERDYHEFVRLHDEERRLVFPEYYTTIDEGGAPHDHLRRWGIQFSAGQEFDAMGHPDDSRPILFVKFLDRSSGRQIVRQPLTVGALLETNAIWSELRTRHEILAGIAPSERRMEEDHWNASLLSELYDKELTLYTAPVHLLSHHAGLTNAAPAYLASATVANIALNLRPCHFASLRPPAAFRPWGGLVPGFLHRHDRAFAYAAICLNGGPMAPDGRLGEWLEGALAASSLPTSADLLAQARREVLSQVTTRSTSPVDEAERFLLETGVRVFDHRARNVALTPGRTAAEGLALPSSFDADGRAIDLSAPPLDRTSFDPVDAYDRQEALQAWLNNFLGACR